MTIIKPGIHHKTFVIVQSLSHVQLFATPWIAALQASLFFIIFQSLLKLMSSKSVMSSNHLMLCHSLLLLPSKFPSIRVFSNESVLCIKVAKVLAFQPQHQSFQYPSDIPMSIPMNRNYYGHIIIKMFPMVKLAVTVKPVKLLLLR